jgi:hypothetical protein
MVLFAINPAVIGLFVDFCGKKTGDDSLRNTVICAQPTMIGL